MEIMYEEMDSCSRRTYIYGIRDIYAYFLRYSVCVFLNAFGKEVVFLNENLCIVDRNAMCDLSIKDSLHYYTFFKIRTGKVEEQESFVGIL